MKEIETGIGGCKIQPHISMTYTHNWPPLMIRCQQLEVRRDEVLKAARKYSRNPSDLHIRFDCP